ncbi:phage major capsid protein [Paraconexibacter antarcticus]|uniref:Phage major capsid protein n=1 Tax=Paraconexibacter antarcticus TaxID=2949664 RepID=A0ABY5DLC7_9ACTN|nr:phage major capsid protein [Paraconexibacter antarcticus]UTI62239.1 phage major capsid protein [Paraconexibacter antarcticus]
MSRTSTDPPITRDELRVLAAHAVKQRDAHARRAASAIDLGGRTDLPSVDRALADSDRWASRAIDFEHRVEISVEPLTYAEESPHSWFVDQLLASGNDGTEARARLDRHDREVELETRSRPARERRADGPDGVSFERRVNPSRNPGQGGSFAPPLWLTDLFAKQPRPGRVLADLIPGAYELPGGCQSVSVPRLIVGANGTPHIDTTAVAEADVTDAAVTSPVTLIPASVDVSLQALEQSPVGGGHLDEIIWADATAAYDAQLEQQLVAGTGANGQILGLLNVPTGAGAANAVTYTDGTPTGPKMLPYAGQAAARIGNNRLMPPQVWLMRTARWAWLGSAEDGQGLPLAVPGHTPPPAVPYLFDDGRPSRVASLLGWPVFPDDAIPQTLGGAPGTQDAILACRPTDMLLWESVPRMSVFTEVQSDTLQARVQMRTYAAALVARIPTGIAVLTGTGMVVQAGWQS